MVILRRRIIQPTTPTPTVNPNLLLLRNSTATSQVPMRHRVCHIPILAPMADRLPRLLSSPLALLITRLLWVTITLLMLVRNLGIIFLLKSHNSRRPRHILHTRNLLLKWLLRTSILPLHSPTPSRTTTNSHLPWVCLLTVNLASHPHSLACTTS